MTSVYALWRYLDGWELVGLFTTKERAIGELVLDIQKWTVPIQYKIDLQAVIS